MATEKKVLLAVFGLILLTGALFLSVQGQTSKLDIHHKTIYPAGGPTPCGSKTGIGSTFTPEQVKFCQLTTNGGE